jgi:class 3 adenylate cyclase
VIHCPRCQHENEDGAKFCEECAAPLARTCGNCGHQVSVTAKFCPECAHPTASTTAAPRFTAPDAYTPKHLAKKILTSKSALEGERKQVTVLFCDLVGSTGLAERLGAEAMHRLLTRFFDLALAEVHRYEGTVNQFLGDGFMALFGAPIAHEDHARRAALAALGLQRAIHERAADLGMPHGESLSVRMGLNTGLVVVGAIGDNLRMDYTAVGDTTNLAARLQQFAEPEAICLSEATYRFVESYIDCEPLGERTLKGKTSPVAVYRLLGVDPPKG